MKTASLVANAPKEALINIKSVKNEIHKNGRFCKNRVKDAIVKTKLRPFGGFSLSYYLCNRKHFAV